MPYVTVREAQRLAYLRTALFVTDPALGPISAAAAAEQYGSLWVITAENPLSQRLSRRENASRHRALLAELNDNGCDHLPAVGRSPDGKWEEHSAAIAKFGRKRATEIGRRHDQNAVFQVSGTRQTVHGCFSTWTRFRSFRDLDWRPEAYSELSLAESIAEAFGVEVESSFWRFRQPGWRYDGDTRLPCHVCGTTLDLFTALLQAKSGAWYEAKAILCAECDEVRLPGHLPRPLRDAVAFWADWRLAAWDAVVFPTTGGEWRCYIVALDDPSGSKLARDVDWVYVGQTSKSPEGRFLEHKSGTKSSKHVRHRTANRPHGRPARPPHGRGGAGLRAVPRGPAGLAGLWGQGRPLSLSEAPEGLHRYTQPIGESAQSRRASAVSKHRRGSWGSCAAVTPDHRGPRSGTLINSSLSPCGSAVRLQFESET